LVRRARAQKTLLSPTVVFKKEADAPELPFKRNGLHYEWDDERKTKKRS